MAATAIEARMAHTAPQFSARSVMLHMIPNIIVSGVLPFVLYQVLKGHGVATVPALCAGALFPTGNTLLHWLRTRQADVIGIITLFSLIVPVAISLISGVPWFVLSKDSFVTGLTGLIFLGSLCAAVSSPRWATRSGLPATTRSGRVRGFATASPRSPLAGVSCF